MTGNYFKINLFFWSFRLFVLIVQLIILLVMNYLWYQNTNGFSLKSSLPIFIADVLFILFYIRRLIYVLKTDSDNIRIADDYIELTNIVSQKKKKLDKNNISGYKLTRDYFPKKIFQSHKPFFRISWQVIDIYGKYRRIFRINKYNYRQFYKIQKSLVEYGYMPVSENRKLFNKDVKGYF